MWHSSTHLVICTHRTAVCTCEQMNDDELVRPLFEPDVEKLRHLTVRLQQTFGLDLFGIDVILENITGRYAIIDVNTFPGFTARLEHTSCCCIHVTSKNVSVDNSECLSSSVFALRICRIRHRVSWPSVARGNVSRVCFYFRADISQGMIS